ncbi:MAG: PPE family protein [Mycobacterium sp.]
MDFGALPPEVNSARMYSGAGPGPMLAASAAWNGLAAELHTASAAYGSVIADLTGEWSGPSAASMAAAATPYVEWMSLAAVQAEQAGAQATAAAAAYEAAFAAHVPPPVVAANRSLLLTLIGTNILGQNTPAIAATEAHYAEMWAQDSVAMYGYAGSSAATTRLTAFTAPPETANQGAAAAAAARNTSSGSTLAGQVSQLTSMVPNALQQVTVGAATATAPAVSGVPSILSGVSTTLASLGGPYTPAGLLSTFATPWLSAMQFVAFGGNVPGFLSLLSGAPAISGALGPLSGGMVSWEVPIAGSAGAVPGAVTVSAVTSQAPMIGGLSVPASWTSTAPGAKLAAAAMPSSAAGATLAADGSAGMFNQMALSSLVGRALGGGAMRSVAGGGVRVLDRAPDTELLTTATILVIPVNED